MIIVDPVALGDETCTRPSLKWVWDRAGTLVEVPADTLAVSYDPADLSKAPFAVVDLEPATNYVHNNTMQGGAPGVYPTGWVATGAGLTPTVVGVGKEDGIEYVDINWSGTSPSTGAFFLTMMPNSTFPDAAAGETWIGSAYLRIAAGSRQGVTHVQLKVGETDAAGVEVASSNSASQINPTDERLRDQQFHLTRVFTNPETQRAAFSMRFQADGASVVNMTLRIGLPQLTRDKLARFPIKTTNGAVTRAADVIGPTAGLIYSNVPMVEPQYNAATTYAKDAAVYDPATKIVYWSMQAANVGKPLSDPAWWNKRTAINRWAMFDDRNSTVTSNPEEIIAVVSARAITQGFFAGALDASEVRISMTHPTRGVVYSETRSLVLPRSGSSFYGWCFNRLRMRTWFRTLKLPVFANALVTITILKPGGVPKCGMALLGPVEDGGSTLMGLSTELKDYSTTTFFADGSSETIPRGFSKRMSVDVSVERDRAESLEDYFTKRRQKTLVIFGSTQRGDAMLVGKVSSFRKVIDSYPRSKMALQIEGVLSQ